jgi:tRNA-dihydrouridine synthase
MCATLTATRGPSHNSVRVPHPRCIHLLLVSNSTYRKVANESVHSQRKIHSWIQHHKLSGFTWDIAAMWKPWIYTQYRKTGVQKDKSTMVCANPGCLKRHLLSQMIGMFHSKGGHLYLKSPNSSTSRMFRFTHRFEGEILEEQPIFLFISWKRLTKRASPNTKSFVLSISACEGSTRPISKS